MNNRTRILFMERLFYEKTDENHSLTVNDITKILKMNGFTATYKTIYADIEALKYTGLDIKHDHKGYRLISRLFDTAEVKILADSVASFKCLNDNQTRRMLNKLKELCSSFVSDEIYREIHISDRIKSDNSEVLINIDKINSAIRDNKQFEFDYFDYDINKKMVCNGKRICSPWAMAINQEQYYVVSFYEKYPESFTNFRIDRMRNIRIINKKRIDSPNEKLDLGNYLKSSFYMFSGKTVRVNLLFPLRNKMCNVALDRFGHDISLRKVDEGHFMVSVPIKVQHPEPFFSWLSLFNGEVAIINSEQLQLEYINFLKRISININSTFTIYS